MVSLLDYLPHCLLAIVEFSLPPLQALLCCTGLQTFFCPPKYKLQKLEPTLKQIYVYVQIETALLNQNVGIFKNVNQRDIKKEGER